jgi:hypothetical protein
MTHDDTKIQVDIDDAFRRFLPIRDVVERNLRAFAYLRARRRRGDDALARQLGITAPDDPAAPLDVNLADAEHYMYARFLASKTGDPSIKALVTGYQLKKYLDSLFRTEQKMRTDSRYPVLPPSTSAIAWGLKGADEGLKDYAAAHGGAYGEFGSAFRANQEFISGQYKPKYASGSVTSAY